jgi:urease accessory protein
MAPFIIISMNMSIETAVPLLEAPLPVGARAPARPTTPGLDGAAIGAPEVIAGPSLLRLLQLSSSLCPIGAFAYSQGLENAVERGWVADEASLAEWLCGIGQHNLAALDLPLLMRAHAAWESADDVAALRVSAHVLANREARELVEQERQLGAALANVLVNLGVPRAKQLCGHASASYVTVFALGAAHFEVGAELAAFGYAFAWSEQQANAAARLVPLGHMATQRVLSAVLTHIPSWVITAKELPDSDIGASTPALAMCAAWHETQYTRLFRS